MDESTVASIKQQLASGASPHEIREGLKFLDYTEEDIEEMFKAAGYVEQKAVPTETPFKPTPTPTPAPTPKKETPQEEERLFEDSDDPVLIILVIVLALFNVIALFLNAFKWGII